MIESGGAKGQARPLAAVAAAYGPALPISRDHLRSSIKALVCVCDMSRELTDEQRAQIERTLAIVQSERDHNRLIPTTGSGGAGAAVDAPRGITRPRSPDSDEEENRLRDRRLRAEAPLLLRQVASTTWMDEIIPTAAKLFYNPHVSTPDIVNAMRSTIWGRDMLLDELDEISDFFALMKTAMRADPDPGVHPASANDLPGLWPGTADLS